MPKRESRTAAVVRVVRERILDGTYAPGERLPGATAIADEFALDRGTAARVLAQLRNAGLVITKPGSGSFVRTFEPIRRRFPERMFAWRDQQFIQDADTGDRPRGVDVVVDEVAAPPTVAEALGIEIEAPVVIRARRFVVDDRPVQIARSYYPSDLVRGTRIVYTNTGPGGVYARLAEIGRGPADFTEVVRTRMPLPEEIDRLELPDGTPVFEIVRIARDASDRPVEVTEMVLDGSAYELEYGMSQSE
jgi:GntR family transcriptional regulator